jgi:glycosyltransferase involved in cell wall biosynthesis
VTVWMKVLQVTAALNEGGVERGTLEMAAFTIAQGSDSFVASHGGKLVPELAALGAVHFQLPLTKRDPISILYNAICLSLLVKSEKIDIVHARSRAPAWAAWFACKLTGARMITTFHGTHKIQNKLKWFYNSSMVRGERVIAISQFIKEHVIKNYYVPESLIDIAPRGFDPEIFNPSEFSSEDIYRIRKKFSLSADDFVISLPGRLTRWKGQEIFLQALAQLKDYPWRALLIGGAGKKHAYEKEMKSLCRSLGLDARVHFLGSQSEIAQFYAISDIVVSASIEPEAFGRVAVEAQAMKKPIIATAHGGSLETVLDGESGWLVPPGDTESLASVLRQVMSAQYNLVDISNRGREWVAKHFTTGQTCQAEWASYQKVINR